MGQMVHKDIIQQNAIITITTIKSYRLPMPSPLLRNRFSNACAMLEMHICCSSLASENRSLSSGAVFTSQANIEIEAVNTRGWSCRILLQVLFPQQLLYINVIILLCIMSQKRIYCIKKWRIISWIWLFYLVKNILLY